MPPERATTSGRFGLMLAGTCVLLPAGLLCEFVGDAEVFPVPGAPSRLRGLMQRHGRPVPVFALSPSDAPEGIAKLRVLVFGTGGEAGALEIDLPPEPVEPVEPIEQPGPPAGAVPASVLSGPWRCAGRDEPFWQFEPARLFAALGAR